jgi:hypothetical protein
VKIIIQLSSGAYRLQELNVSAVPDGWIKVADGVDETPLIKNGGFVAPTFTDGIATSFTPDTAAWEAWKAAHPEQPQTDPIADLTEMTCNLLYEIDKLKLGVTES